METVNAAQTAAPAASTAPNGVASATPATAAAAPPPALPVDARGRHVDAEGRLLDPREWVAGDARVPGGEEGYAKLDPAIRALFDGSFPTSAKVFQGLEVVWGKRPDSKTHKDGFDAWDKQKSQVVVALTRAHMMADKLGERLVVRGDDPLVFAAEKRKAAAAGKPVPTRATIVRAGVAGSAASAGGTPGVDGTMFGKPWTRQQSASLAHLLGGLFDGEAILDGLRSTGWTISDAGVEGQNWKKLTAPASLTPHQKARLAVERAYAESVEFTLRELAESEGAEVDPAQLAVRVAGIVAKKLAKWDEQNRDPVTVAATGDVAGAIRPAGEPAPAAAPAAPEAAPAAPEAAAPETSTAHPRGGKKKHG